MNNLEILQGLNGGKPDKELEYLIDSYIEEFRILESKSTYRILKTEDASEFILGKDIKSYVENSKYVALFLVTGGVMIDQKLKRLSSIDRLAYLVYDSVSSYYIEEMAEKVQKEIEKELLVENKYMLNRFSTGYGDYPIDVNKKFVDFLNGNRLGVFLTEKNMFIPSKTICGIIAAGDVTKSFNFCKTCNLTKTCQHIKGGRKCYE